MREYTQLCQLIHMCICPFSEVRAWYVCPHLHGNADSTLEYTQPVVNYKNNCTATGCSTHDRWQTQPIVYWYIYADKFHIHEYRKKLFPQLAKVEANNEYYLSAKIHSSRPSVNLETCRFHDASARVRARARYRKIWEFQDMKIRKQVFLFRLHFQHTFFKDQ